MPNKAEREKHEAEVKSAEEDGYNALGISKKHDRGRGKSEWKGSFNRFKSISFNLQQTWEEI